MKLSVKPRFGMTRVRGGQVLRVSHDHQVSTKGYDKRPDDAFGKSRSFDAGWVTASIGDLAVEVIATKTERVLGYAYLSGSAINVVRYVSDADRALVAGWLTPARGIRVTSPAQDMDVSDFVAWMREVKYADADVVATTFGCAKGRMSETTQFLARVYSRAPAPDDRKPPTADLIARVQGDGDKEFGVIHFQTPERTQDQACQPFPCDLLLSSPVLQDQSPVITCPETFHQCPRSTSHGNFGLIDLTTGTKDPATAKFTRADAPTLTPHTEPEARRLAEQRYPGCAFALSTIGNTLHEGVALPPGMPDTVVVAVLYQLDAERCNVVAYVVASVEGTGCIPFTPAIWPDLRDLLPHDRRRPQGSTS